MYLGELCISKCIKRALTGYFETKTKIGLGKEVTNKQGSAVW